MKTKTINPEVKKIDDELAPLYREKEIIERKITVLYNKRKELRNQADLNFSISIPEDILKISKIQWEWILSASHDESEAQYKFSSNFLEKKLGFYRNGFRPEINQAALSISQYGLKIEKILEGFKYLKKHLKPVTVEDKRHGIETGIRFEVSGLDDNYTSVVYVHKDETVALYVSSYNPVKNFKNFKKFLNWYTLRLVEIEKQGFESEDNE